MSFDYNKSIFNAFKSGERWVCPWWRSDDLNRMQLLIWWLFIFGFVLSYREMLHSSFLRCFCCWRCVLRGAISKRCQLFLPFLTEAFSPSNLLCVRYGSCLTHKDCPSDEVNGVWLVYLDPGEKAFLLSTGVSVCVMTIAVVYLQVSLLHTGRM